MFPTSQVPQFRQTHYVYELVWIVAMAVRTALVIPIVLSSSGTTPSANSGVLDIDIMVMWRGVPRVLVWKGEGEWSNNSGLRICSEIG